MDRKPTILLIVVLVLGVLLIAAAGIVYVVSQQSQKPPEVKLPPSLDEVAKEYPELASMASTVTYLEPQMRDIQKGLEADRT